MFGIDFEIYIGYSSLGRTGVSYKKPFLVFGIPWAGLESHTNYRFPFSGIPYGEQESRTEF